MKKVFLMMALAMGAMHISCASGRTASAETVSARAASDDNVGVKTYYLKDFQGVQLSGAFHVTYTEGATYEVKVRADESMFDVIVLEVEKGVLVAKFKKQTTFNSSDKMPELMITAPKMNQITCSGACSFETAGLTADEFRVTASGATKLNLGTVHCQSAEITNSGATETNLKLFASTTVKMRNSGASKGKMEVEAVTFEVSNSGATNMDYTFLGNAVEVRNSGAGNSRMKVDCRSLHCTNSGVSNIEITGTADDVTLEGSGRSKVNVKGLNKY